MEIVEGLVRETVEKGAAVVGTGGGKAVGGKRGRALGEGRTETVYVTEMKLWRPGRCP